MTTAPPTSANRLRRRLSRVAMIATLGLGAAITVSSSGSADDLVLTGPGVSISDEAGPADPYPSTITVGGVPASIVSVRVTLNELSHTYPDDLNIAVQAPDGTSVALMTGCGGNRDVEDVTLTFADDGTAMEPDSGPLETGTYAPSRCFLPVFEDDPESGLTSPCPCWTRLGALTGGAANGDWKLWVYDAFDSDGGSLAGWTLELTTNAAPVAGNRSLTVRRDGTLRGSVAGLATDAENDDLRFGLAAAPSHGRVVVNANGTFRYVPAARFVGMDRFTYRVGDGDSTDTGTVTISVTLPVRTCAGRRATIVGTAGGDVLSGTRRGDVIFAGGGRDSIRGGGGNDVICAGPGGDTVRTGLGNDTLYGGGGRDVLHGGAGHDTIQAAAGNDVLVGFTGDDTLLAGIGPDTLVGSAGTDSCAGGPGRDRASTCEVTRSIP